MTATAVARRTSARTCDDYELKIASTRVEREGAFQLAYTAYVRAGLCQENNVGLRATRYQLLQSTDIFIACLRGKIISTLSLVRDDYLGLPMEQIYPREVVDRRHAGLRVAEVSCLADRRRSDARNFELFCDLCRLMVQHADLLQLDLLLVVVHPRHVPLYRRYLAFQQIGDKRDYPDVQGSPAVPLALDLKSSETRRHRNWDKFFGARLPTSMLRPQPISLEDVAYFESLLSAPCQPGRWEDYHVTPGSLREPEHDRPPIVTMGNPAMAENFWGGSSAATSTTIAMPIGA